MRINKGVEWASHACALLVPLWPDNGLPLAALAEFYELPEPYMAKQMQALAKAGIVTGGRGRSGFYTLSRAPSEITMLDILLAIDGDEPMFRCTEIRRRGPCAAKPSDCKLPCNVAAKYAEAEQAYRSILAETDLATLASEAAMQLEPEKLAKAGEWMSANMRSRS